MALLFTQLQKSTKYYKTTQKNHLKNNESLFYGRRDNFIVNKALKISDFVKLWNLKKSAFVKSTTFEMCHVSKCKITWFAHFK
jgi:hypothetical protein